MSQFSIELMHRCNHKLINLMNFKTIWTIWIEFQIFIEIITWSVFLFVCLFFLYKFIYVLFSMETTNHSLFATTISGCRISCWMNETPYNNILVAPVCISMMLNLMFLCNIVRVLFMKLRAPAGPQGGAPSRNILQAFRYVLPCAIFFLYFFIGSK